MKLTSSNSLMCTISVMCSKSIQYIFWHIDAGLLYGCFM